MVLAPYFNKPVAEASTGQVPQLLEIRFDFNCIKDKLINSDKIKVLM